MKLSLLEKKILVVEDERLMRNLLIQMLKRMGFKDVNAVDNAEEVVNTNKFWKTDLLVTDIEMEGMSGLDLIGLIRNERSPLSPEVPIMVLTGMSKLQILMEAAEQKIQGFLTKPVSEDILRQRIEEILGKSSQLVYRDPQLIIETKELSESSQEPLKKVSDNFEDDKNEKEQQENMERTETIIINNVLMDLDKLTVGMVLGEDIVARGHTILLAGKVIQEGHVKVLNDLSAFIDKKEILVNLEK